MSCFVNQIDDLQTIGKKYSRTFCLPWALLILWYPLSDSMGLSMSWWQLSISDSQPSGWHSWEDLVHLYQTADNYGSLETNKLIFWRISCHKNSPIFYQIFHYFFSYMGFPCLQHTYDIGVLVFVRIQIVLSSPLKAKLFKIYFDKG